MSYFCRNRDCGYDEWICLCPPKDKKAKDHILNLNNSWICELIKSSKKKCLDHNFTEEDALKEIASLEEEASGRLAMFKWSN